MTPFDDETLNAYADGELDAAEYARLEAALAADPQQQARLADIRRVTWLGRAAVDGLARTEVPDIVRERVWPVEEQPERTGFSPYWAAAAALVVGLGVGAWLVMPGETPISELAMKPVAWPQQAAWYHGLAVARQAHSKPLIFDLEYSEITPLEAALRQKLERDVRVPDLSRRGLTLLGARLLVERLRPLAQIFYRDSQGELVSLLVAIDVGPDVAPQFQRVGELPVLIWREGETAYVLAGDGEGERLHGLAVEVLEQTQR